MGFGVSKVNAGSASSEKSRSSLQKAPNSSGFSAVPKETDSPTLADRATPAVGAADGRPKLLGKEKYVKDYGAIAMEDRKIGGGTVGRLFLFCEPKTECTVLSYHETSSDSVFARSFTDEQLTAEKASAGVKFSWAPFFKSIASAVLKSKAIVTAPSSSTRLVSFEIVNSKDTSVTYPFVVQLNLVSNGRSPDSLAVFQYVMYPMTRALQYKKTKESDRALSVDAMETAEVALEASLAQCRTDAARLLPLIRPLREDSAYESHVAMTLSRDVRDMERKIRFQRERPISKHRLDQLYDQGGAQPFLHTPWSPEHIPYEEEPSEALSACIRAAFPIPEGGSLHAIADVLRRPDLNALIEKSGERELIESAFEIFKGIDQWDYDTIQLEIVTNGNALFYTTYLLLYKLDLVDYFKIDDQTLRNFLVAVQASYHPNPYHNSMHGADVTQINYYIITVAGLQTKCRLSKEEQLAAIISGAIHDFDHPGMNNNFHSRTNAFLATLYNDRSILENHHLACSFELMRNPRYNVLATLTPEQRQAVRDTMVEMVLATDMGNHGKIFKSFQMRMGDTSDWHSKKEDVRLALCMSLKMADISNCARPNHIYAEWAKNISTEFYLQGDAERKLQLSISPFMDRSKEKEDFPKGQISFMMYIVQPMVEAMAEFLPSLSFAINLCDENKQYWKRKQEEAEAAALSLDSCDAVL